MYLEEAREKHNNKCDHLHDEELSYETNIEMLHRVQKLKQMILEYSKTYKKILLVAHLVVFKYLLATNASNEEILRDETDTLKPDGHHMENCEKMCVTLENNGTVMQQNGII